MLGSAQPESQCRRCEMSKISLPSEPLSKEGCREDAAQVQVPVLEADVEAQDQVLGPKSRVSPDHQRLEQAPLVQSDHEHRRP